MFFFSVVLVNQTLHNFKIFGSKLIKPLAVLLSYKVIFVFDYNFLLEYIVYFI
jgi:hypothetical protein